MKLFGSLREIVNLVFRKNSQEITLRPNQATTYTANRDIQTPPQDADSVLVSQNATQTLTNKTIDGDDNTVQDLALTSLKTVIGDANKVIRRNGSGVVVSDNSVPNSSPLVTTDATQTLTNKSIDADTNTITNIENADIKAAAAIDATKIANGTVSNTEFQFLDGVTSSIQTQISAKVTGPASATDEAMVRFDGTTGKLVQDSVITATDAGTLSGITQLNVDNLRLDANTLSSTNTNGNVVLDPNGTGIIDAQASVQVVGSLRSDTSLILEETGAGTDIITIQAPASIAANYTLTLPTTDGNSSEFLQTDGSGVLTWATPAGAQTSAYDIKNGTITSSVAANALTVALKDAAGSDPSALSPVNISFRSSTAANGTYNVRSVTAALSMVVSSGSTLGHSSGSDQPIYIYALDNAGTVELAVSFNLFDEGMRQSTTAEGGAGAADSGSVMYSTTARSNVPVRLIGKLVSNQTVAGTWAATPTVFESVVADRPAKVIMGDQAAGTVGIGYIGEYLSATRTFSNANTLTTGTDNTVCSFNIEPGIWLVSGALGFIFTATTTVNYANGAIINGGTSTAGFADQIANVNFSTMGTIYIGPVYNGGTQGNTVPSHAFPATYVRLTANTTFNLVAQAGFGVSTCKAFGSMNAVRIG